MPANVSVGARTGFERFILDRQKQLSAGNKGYVITPEEYAKAAKEYFGDIPLPEGAKEVSRTPLELIYEVNGKRYRAFRNTNSDLGLDTGKIETSQTSAIPGVPDTAVPAIAPQSVAGEADLATRLLPKLEEYLGKAFGAGQTPGQQAGTQPWMDALMNNANKLGQPPALASLDPQTAAALAAIENANQMKLQQGFEDQSGDLVASLYGKGINRSSIAGSQANRLLQGQGLVQAQSNSDAAMRELALRQYLTTTGQQGLATAGEQYGAGGGLALNSFQASNAQAGQGIQLLEALLQQMLQRETAGITLNQGQQQITNQNDQFTDSFGLSNLQNELADQQRRHQNNAQMWSQIVGGGLSLATSLFAPGAGLLSGLGKSGAGTASSIGANSGAGAVANYGATGSYY